MPAGLFVGAVAAVLLFRMFDREYADLGADLAAVEATTAPRVIGGRLKLLVVLARGCGGFGLDCVGVDVDVDVGFGVGTGGGDGGRGGWNEAWDGS